MGRFGNIYKWLRRMSWHHLHLHSQTRHAHDFIKSSLETRKRTLESIREDNELDADERLVAQEASTYLGMAESLIRKSNLNQAYNLTLMAERRILILLLNKRSEFPTMVKLRRMNYQFNANRLREEGELENGEEEKLDSIIEKDILDDSDWLTLSSLIARAGFRMVAPMIKRATTSDKILRRLVLFSVVSSVILLSLLFLTLVGLITLVPEELVRQIMESNTTIEPSSDLLLVTIASDLSLVTITSVFHFITLLCVIAFGILGALVFGMISQRRTLAVEIDLDRLEAPILNVWFDASRLVLGAISAPVVVIFVYSGIFQLDGLLNPIGVFAISFISGYSEILLVKAVENSIPIDREIEKSLPINKEMEGSPLIDREMEGLEIVKHREELE